MGELETLTSTSKNLTDIRNSIVEAIPCDPPSAKEDLRRMSFSDILFVYVGWMDRFIEPRKREPRVWDGFWSEQAVHHARKIDDLAKLSSDGDDLTPYLSSKVHASGFAPNSKNRSGIVIGGKDRALNAYGVHHLHLVPRDGRGKRTAGSDELVFVKTRRDHILFVMLGNHKSFDDGSLRQAVADLEVASGNYIRGIVGVTSEKNAAEGEDLARKGINTVTKARGKFSIPGLLSSALTSEDHLRHTDRMVETIEKWEPLIRTATGRRQLCAEYDVPYEQASVFGWSIRYTNLYLVEVASGRPVFVLQSLR